MFDYLIEVYAYCDRDYDPMDILRVLAKAYLNVECRYYPDEGPAYYIFTVPLEYHPINDDGGNEIHEVIEDLNYLAGEGNYRMVIEEKRVTSEVIFSNNPNFENKEGE